MQIATESAQIQLGKKIGQLLKGGELIELKGDIGTGKTTLVKGFAQGLLINEDVQSPSFTISRFYKNNKGLNLFHYDFYRLNDAGIMKNEIAEVAIDGNNIVAIEWAGAVKDVLPEKRIIINIFHQENGRKIVIDAPDDFAYILEGLKK